ncbi:sigma-54-dependent transcriptional regulator [Vagococcus lutrae]|uniref:sigma-54-dependent transcriptional regulator n=1 Tax=Vagococcus lutrae TaxID=81947 RepID=UPI001443E4B9|nr:sigma-54-dependent transcriptional regulator [Vagococcus lutrae]NKZ27044.1 sigma 54-interacting transcriptional regulator [Vagococcus lutrae]
MKRVERVFLFVSEKTKELSSEDIEKGAGITTREVAKALDIQRSNASKDLNELVKDGLLLKTDGRPVRYLIRSEQTERPTPFSKRAVKPTPSLSEHDIFERMIGANGSMRVPIEQAKAAIMYPPKGLNCLITGATGSGKTHFAHIMFEFAKAQGLIKGHQELVVFNCADYAHNSELLMSHLFGYVAGAFTGATADKEGLIAKADGGMLFLDEVHRLPPEGQEMIFYFMDHGKYSRLGETTKESRADVRIISATTEDTTSYLLQTFVRRIPIHIQLPSFEQRQTKEKIDLVKLMVGMESERIQRSISLTEDVVKALIGSVTYGNIGQLKSNIQLTCARSFLNHMDKEEIVITVDDLTEEVKSGLTHLANDRQTSAELSQYLDPVMAISSDEALLPHVADAYELPYNLYEIINEKAALLRDDGVDQESINQFIMTDIHAHLNSFYKNYRLTFDIENQLAEIVDPAVIEVTKEIYEVARLHLGDQFQVNFIYAMSLHISSFLKRHNSDYALTTDDHKHDSIRKMVKEYPAEYDVALEIKRLLYDAFQVEIPVAEVEYLTVLLVSLKKASQVGRIGMVVAAHGNSTATSMVQVVKQLFGSDNILAVDMPLEMKPRVALEEMITAVERVDQGRGVMILVDMGSLATFSEEITRRTDIEVRTVDMVTTALVLEVARKTELLDTDLEELYQSTKKFRGYGSVPEPTHYQASSTPAQSKRAILAICASGKGTAERMKELIETYVAEVGEKNLEVLPISVVDMKNVTRKIQQDYHVIAATGIVDPDIGVTYIPMEALFSGEGKKIIQEELMDAEMSSFEPVVVDDEQALQLCYDYFESTFLFINANRIIPLLWDYTQNVEQRFIPVHSQSFRINFMMHLGGMIERLLHHDVLTVDESQRESFSDSLFLEMRRETQVLEETLGMTVPNEELYYLVQIVDNTLTREGS